MTLNQKILDVVIIFGLILTLIAIPLSLISNTLPSNDRLLFVFAQQVTDNTTTTRTPSTATVEGGQRQGQSTSTMTATSDNYDTLLLLPSWNEGDVKEKIINFVKNVTNPEKSDYYIPPDKRIAVFDNDGTLWSEKPIPFEGYFALDLKICRLQIQI